MKKLIYTSGGESVEDEEFAARKMCFCWVLWQKKVVFVCVSGGFLRNLPG